MDVVEEKAKQFKQAIQKIIERAKEDGVITEEEQAIIDTIKFNIESYQKMLEKALDDNIITQEERNQLNDLEEKIYGDSYFTAMDDKVISKDESTLIKTLLWSVDPDADVSWLKEDMKE
ncbi:MAG: hypothetical protein INQ03_22625 [Candidatus Heimdallarchaeota archaeon]|nr:hypothetical protein [Candidatus Heimdallarchaeota archaeon]